MRSIAIVAPVYNEDAVLPAFVSEVRQVMDALADRYTVTLLLVDDGSSDASWGAIRTAAHADWRISGLRLSRNFGHQAALACGYQLAQADAVVTMDSDLQDPPSLVPALVAEWERGAKVVLAARRSRQFDGPGKRLTAMLYYYTMAAVAEGAPIEQAGDFRLLDAQVVEALNTLPERHRYIRGLIGWLGFTPAIVHYDRQSRRAGHTKYPVHRMVALAIDGLVSLSFVPLRLAYVLAGLSALPVLGYLLYNVILRVAFGVQMVPGWSSLILTVTLFGVANLVMLGIMGEYAGRIYTEVKRRPLFVVAESCGTRVPVAQAGARDT